MSLLRAKYSTQNLKEPSSFFAKSTRAFYGKEKGLMAFNSSSSSIYYFTKSNSYRLLQYSPLYFSSEPGSSGIEYTSPSFLFGGIFFGSLPGNTLWYLHSKSYSRLWCF